MCLRRLFCIGGGEIKSKTTFDIDRYIAGLIKDKVKPNRGYALFIGTASHDCMPYFNSFRKTYTSCFDIKVEPLLLVDKEVDINKVKDKFDKADMIYIGGGDTLFMLDIFNKYGITQMIYDCYNRGVIIAGLSAGGICFFEKMFTDSFSVYNDNKYRLINGLGLIHDNICPHYNELKIDFENQFLTSDSKEAFAVENDCALFYENEQLKGAISSGGNAYCLRKNINQIEKYIIDKIN